MKYTMVRLFLSAAFCCALSLVAQPASAGWGLLHGGSSGGAGYGSYGSGGGGSSGGYGVASYGVASYGSSGGSSGYAAYGSTGGSSGGGSSGQGHGPGPLRRLAAHLHDHMAAKHARRAAYASSGGSSGYGAAYGSSGGSSGYSTSYGSSGYSTSYGSSGGYGASYGSTGSYYGSTGSSYSADYLGVSSQSPTSAAALAAYRADGESDAIYLNVDVPSAAKVFVNDMPTSSTGASRQYVSRGLIPGKSYNFELRAEILAADGQVATETKTVSVTAGQRESIRFVSLQDTPVQTAVTLNVPADAKVILAGNETKATGENRTFRTSQLKAGEQWDDYVVEVHYDGQVKRESLRLVAGDSVSLTFNFDQPQDLVASR